MNAGLIFHLTKANNSNGGRDKEPWICDNYVYFIRSPIHSSKKVLNP